MNMNGSSLKRKRIEDEFLTPTNGDLTRQQTDSKIRKIDSEFSTKNLINNKVTTFQSSIPEKEKNQKEETQKKQEAKEPIDEEKQALEKKKRLEEWKQKSLYYFLSFFLFQNLNYYIFTNILKNATGAQGLMENLKEKKEQLQKQKEIQEQTKKQEEKIPQQTHQQPTSQTHGLNSFSLKHVAPKKKGSGALQTTSSSSIFSKEDINFSEKQEEEAENGEDSLEKYMKSIENQISKDNIKTSSNEIEKTSLDEKTNDDGDKRAAEKEKTSFNADDEDDDEDFESTKESADSETQNKKDLKPIDHSKIDYPPFTKNFYIIPKEIEKMDPSVLEDYLKLHKISVRGKNAPPILTSWHHTGLNNTILNIIDNLGFKEPFPIQATAIPCIMSGRNVIGIAKTGSGKTFAFLYPLLRHVLDQPPLKPGDGPIGLVLSPVRELTQQIYTDLIQFTKPLGLKVVCAFGGGAMAEQIAALKRGAHIVVSTPGRWIDLLCANHGRVTNLRRVTYMVLDEADRMFDMGFTQQVTKIAANVRPDKQIVLFSATFPKQLEAYARKFVKESIQIIVGGRSVACDSVKQHVIVLQEEEKNNRLLGLLGKWMSEAENEEKNILIFVEKQTTVGELYKFLVEKGYNGLCLHGSMDQIDRYSTIQAFKKKEKNMLIATSIAARGLDVKDLKLVINFDAPNHYEDYVHRVGRTGRAGNTGTAYTFVTPSEERYAPDLVRALKTSNNEVPKDLQKLCDGFLEKKKNGLVDKVPGVLSGFVTNKGYKFDASERNKKKEDIKRQAQTLGMSEDFGDLEVSEDLMPSIEEAAANDVMEPVASVKSLPTSSADVNNGAMPSIVKEIEKKYQQQQLLASGKLSQYSTPSLQRRIEINDIPKLVRFNVTQKDFLFDVQDKFPVNISVKGRYFEDPRSIPAGEEKIHLLLDGADEDDLIKTELFLMRTINSQIEELPAAAKTAPKHKYKL